MIDSLPDLHRAASAILELFTSHSSTPSGIVSLAQALQDPKSSESRRLQRMRSNFTTQRDCFGDSNTTYFVVEQVAAKLPVLDDVLPANQSWRADGILYKANCAQLALAILTKPTRTGDAEDSMYDLEGKYPLPFLNALVRTSQLDLAGQSGLRRPTLDLALDMRTQFLMTSLFIQRDHDDYNPQSLLQNVFFNEILETQAEESSLLRGFNLPTLQDGDGNLPETYQDDVLDRVRDIQEYFSEESVDFDGLEARFPWEGFVYSVAKWLRSRNEELDRFLKQQQPSVDEIHDQLEDAVSSRQRTTSTSSQRRHTLPAVEEEKAKKEKRKSARGFSDSKPIQWLVRRARELAQTNEQPQSSTDPDQTLVGDGDLQEEEEDIESSRPQRGSQQPTQSSQGVPSSRSILDEIRKHKQGRSFIDRQTNASRVSPVDSQRFSQVRGSKRTLVETANESDEEDDDDEYEEDSRDVDFESRRAAKPAPKRQRTDAERRLPQNWQSPPSHPTQQQPSTQASPQTPNSGVRYPQVRRRWSTAEDEQLISLVGKHGTSWAMIKHQDDASPHPQLQFRNQVQLKDRARNLVMIWLRYALFFLSFCDGYLLTACRGGRTELPANFNIVALKQKDVEDLESRGIRIPERPVPRHTQY